MPADDLTINVRQIAGYTAVGGAVASDALLMQRGGLGGPYASISPADLVGTALSSGGDMVVGGSLTAFSISGGSLQYSNGMFGALSAQKACIVDFSANVGTINGVPIATTLDVAASVTSFNQRSGAVFLQLEDIVCAGGAPLFSPRFLGNPRAMTPCPESNSTRLATTAYVTAAVASLIAGEAFVTSFNTRIGAIVLNAADIVAADPPYAPLDSPNLSGNPTAPTAAQGTSDGQIATTAFVQNAITESTTGVASFNGRTGAVLLSLLDVTSAGGAPLASPSFAGTPTAPTPTAGNNSNQIATTAFVETATSGGYAPINSPTFTGIPAGPTAAVGTNSTQLATTAYVLAAITSVDAGVISFNGRTGAVSLLANDISAAGGAILASPAFTGVPTAPTAASGVSTTQIATTAFVAAAIAAGGVASFNGRSGVVTLSAADVNAAGGPYLQLIGGTLSGPLTGTAATFSGAGRFGGQLSVAAGSNSIVGPATGATWIGITGGPVPLTTGCGTIILNGGTRPTFAFELYNGSTRITTVDGGGGFATLGGVSCVGVTTSGALNVTAGGASIGGSVGVNGAITATNNVNITSPATGQLAFSINDSSGVAKLQTYWNTTTGNGGLYHTFSGQQMYSDNSGNWTVTSGAYKPGGGPWSASSDARTKIVDGDYELGLDEVLALRPVVYRYRGNDTPAADVKAGRDGKATQTSSAPYPTSTHHKAAVDQTRFVGLVAQEIEAIFPGMVTKAAGFIDGVRVNDLRQLDASELVFALVNAVKALASRVATLEAAA